MLSLPHPRKPRDMALNPYKLMGAPAPVQAPVNSVSDAFRIAELRRKRDELRRAEAAKKRKGRDVQWGPE